MKKIIQSRLVVLLLANIFCDAIFAQVNTPNGTNVEYCTYTYNASDAAAAESQAAQWLFARGWTNDVIKTAPATNEYNCHSYAWYRSEGGTGNYWIKAFTNADLSVFFANNPNSPLPTPKNITKYWNDGSYVEVSESNATKVWYGSCWTWNSSVGWENMCDHSAVRITSGPNEGKYESKWGTWPRYIHPADKCPYNISSRRYYIKRPIITGPSEMCSNSTATFSVTPPNITVTWTCSSNLTAGTESGNNKNFTANGNGQGWVAVNVGGNEVFRRSVWLGVPSVNVSYEVAGRAVVLPPGTLISTYDVFIGDTVLFLSNAQPTTSSVTWTSTAIQYSPNGSSTIYYIFPDGGVLSGGYNVKATASNSCGTAINSINIYPSPGKLIKKLAASYPNPASDVLNITIEASASQNLSRQQGSVDTKSLQTAATYDIRLYSRHGRLLRQATTHGENVQFDVTHLHEGIYYLHIYDGVGEKPEIHQIMVKH